MNSVFKKMSLVVIFLSCFVNAQTVIDSTSIYFRLKEFDKAMDFAIRHEDYNSLFEYGSELFDQEDYIKALPLLISGYEIGKDLISIDDKIEIELQIGTCYFSNYGFKDAIVYYESGLKLQESIYGVNGQGYIKLRNYLAYIYQLIGDYSKAEKTFLKNIEIGEKVLGRKDLDYALSLRSLANLYKEIGNYNLSESLYLRAVEITIELSGENNPDYLTLLTNLADLYSTTDKNAKAEELYLKSIAISLQIFGEDDLDYAQSLLGLANFYSLQKKYNLSEPLFYEALKIRKEVLGQKSIYYVSTLNNLTTIYLDQGKYERVELILFRAIEITKEIFGEKHIEYANSLQNLADFYRIINLGLKAEELYNKALIIIKEALGDQNPDYLLLLGDLAHNYSKDGKFSKGETLYLELLELQKEILGENHPTYAHTLLMLGSNYYSNNNYTQAEKYYLKSLKVNKDIFGENNQRYISILCILANLYRITESNDMASIYFEKSLSLGFKKVLDKLYYMSADELIYYVNSTDNRLTLSSSFSLINKYPESYPEININAFKYELLIKSLSLRTRDFIKNSIQKTNNKSLQEKYEQFLTIKEKINDYNELPIYKRPTNFETLKRKTEQIEKELLKESLDLIKYKKLISPDWPDLKSKLTNTEISITIVSFVDIGGIVKYSAFIIGNDFKFPKFIPLFEEKQLELFLLRDNIQSDSIQINKQYSKNSLSDLFLNPLEKELLGIKTIYLSPSGLGHQIDFSALPLAENKTLGETYNLHLLSSPTELVDFKASYIGKKSNPELLLYGGIDYNKSKESISSDTKSLNDTIDSNLATRSGIKSFGYLQATNKEIEQIGLSAKQNGFKATLLTERAATEASIKALDGKNEPFVLHLATHGFFFPDPEKDISQDMFGLEGKSKIYKKADDPMMRSGLLFAGANKFWGKPNANQTTDDGILTANEISNLDLSACELVVLSACETGLGKVQGGEGVFGLQRAFKMAGVKNIIMSLWKVPDAQTAELFELFYNECLIGTSIHEAFKIAQSTMKAKYAPYYWAGFVLLE